MAEDKNKNEDPEEDKKDIFDDEEDFGLPDLEYDELDDDEDEEEVEDDNAFGADSSDDVLEEESSEPEVSENLDDVDLGDDTEVSEEQEDW